MNNIMIGIIIAFVIPFCMLVAGDAILQRETHWECNILAGLSGVLIFFIVWKWIRKP